MDGEDVPVRRATLPIYVISLLTATVRRAKMQARLDALGLDFSWVQAIDTRDLSKRELDNVFDERARCRYARRFGDLRGSGELGCHLSHLLAYRRLLQSEAECCLILEDDAVLDPEIAGCLGLIRQAAPEIDLIFLNDGHPHKLSLPIGSLDGVRQFRLKRFGGVGAYAYTINRRARHRLDHKIRRHLLFRRQRRRLVRAWERMRRATGSL